MIQQRGHWAALLVLAVLALILSACSTGSPAKQSAPADLKTTKVSVDGGGSYTNVDAAGLKSMLAGKDFPLINVHIPYEGEIEKTDLFIQYDLIDKNLDKLPANKSARIVLYCRSGSMSGIAAKTLVRLGYTGIWNLDGGMIAWQSAGYSIITNKQ